MSLNVFHDYSGVSAAEAETIGEEHVEVLLFCLGQDVDA